MPEYRIRAVVTKQFQTKKELNKFINTEAHQVQEVLMLCNHFYRAGQLCQGSRGLIVKF